MEKNHSRNPWYIVENASDVNSPSILVYPDRIESNIRKMIEIAGGPQRLRPHVKTHKLAEVVKLQMNHGITKFKCATVSEAEMTATCGASDILLAMQPVGPNLDRFFNLKKQFRGSDISCIADDENIIAGISEMAVKTGLVTKVWLDINTGMNRTGISIGEKAEKLFAKISGSPKLIAEGIHAYDGHIHEPDPKLRKKICDDSFASVTDFVNNLTKKGFKNIKTIAGGTPTFPVHARRKDVELSPGTILLWDYGYSQSFKDMDFLHAAVLLTRIVSKPGKDLLCLDLGHKSVASEMPQPRVKLMDISDYEIVGHNEEHMVIKTNEAVRFKTGDALYGIPWHICPTIDRHDTATVIRNNRAEEEWKIVARRRKITI
jgi:D-serine deaminase-like pyridoxal phosphate-dependent protein